MRWLAWTMLMAIAVGAGAAGVNSELNPVRTHPHGTPATAIHRLIVKFRAASSSTQGPKAAQDRVAALTGRTGLTLRASRSITGAMHVVHVEPVIAGEPVAVTFGLVHGGTMGQGRFPQA